MLKSLVIVVVLVAAAVFSVVALSPTPARCAYCYSGVCYNDFICGTGCRCMIAGGEYAGKCYNK